MAQMFRLCISMAILTAVPVLTEGETKSVRLPNSTVVRIAKRIEVNVDPERDLHGPCVIRTGSDNLLLCHQDSNKHRGGVAFLVENSLHFTTPSLPNEFVDGVFESLTIAIKDMQYLGLSTLTGFVTRPRITN